jgi:hypothetical protein
MRIACWTPKATNAHTGCVVILIAFALPQWLDKQASMYTASRVTLRTPVYVATQ